MKARGARPPVRADAPPRHKAAREVPVAAHAANDPIQRDQAEFGQLKGLIAAQDARNLLVWQEITQPIEQARQRIFAPVAKSRIEEAFFCLSALTGTWGPTGRKARSSARSPRRR